MEVSGGACVAPPTGACSRYLLHCVSALWFSFCLSQSLPASSGVFPEASRRETAVESLSRRPEPSLKSGGREMAGKGSSSTPMPVDEDRSRPSWHERFVQS